MRAPMKALAIIWVGYLSMRYADAAVNDHGELVKVPACMRSLLENWSLWWHCRPTGRTCWPSATAAT